MLAMAATALSGMWKKPGTAVPDTLGSSTNQPGQEVMAQNKGSENVQYQGSNSQGRLPALSGLVPRKSRGRRRGRDEGISWSGKKIDHEFDFVIVPSDAVYMSGSESDDSDYSVGWFEPHSANFTENEDEESFQVLVPSYRSSAVEFKPKTIQVDNKDSPTPPWASLLSNLSHYTNSDMQKQLELWLQSLTSNN